MRTSEGRSEQTALGGVGKRSFTTDVCRFLEVTGKVLQSSPPDVPCAGGCSERAKRYACSRPEVSSDRTLSGAGVGSMCCAVPRTVIPASLFGAGGTWSVKGLRRAEEGKDPTCVSAPDQQAEVPGLSVSPLTARHRSGVGNIGTDKGVCGAISVPGTGAVFYRNAVSVKNALA